MSYFLPKAIVAKFLHLIEIICIICIDLCSDMSQDPSFQLIFNVIIPLTQESAVQILEVMASGFRPEDPGSISDTA